MAVSWIRDGYTPSCQTGNSVVCPLLTARLRRLAVPLSIVRAMFEFVLPLVVGAYAIYVLMAFRCNI